MPQRIFIRVEGWWNNEVEWDYDFANGQEKPVIEILYKEILTEENIDALFDKIVWKQLPQSKRDEIEKVYAKYGMKCNGQ